MSIFENCRQGFIFVLKIDAKLEKATTSGPFLKVVSPSINLLKRVLKTAKLKYKSTLHECARGPMMDAMMPCDIRGSYTGPSVVN